MFARQRAAVFEREIGDRVGDGFEFLHALCGLQIHDRTNMKAADRCMSIDASRRAVVLNKLKKFFDVVAQLLGRDRGVLDEGE